MPIEVIGAGLGRTGTLSLKAALEELGFGPCYHMVEVLKHPAHVRVWDAAARGEAVDWGAIFADYRSTVDWPGCSFYRELMARYPDAKVVLSVRDAGSWYDSARRTIYAVREMYPVWVLALIPRFTRFGLMTDRIIWRGMFRRRFEDRDFAIEVFDRHNDEVRRAVPPDRLLVYDVKQGWPPLCAFLGVPVPEGKPFPHLNDAEEFRAGVKRGARRVRAIAYTVLGALALIAALIAGRLLA